MTSSTGASFADETPGPDGKPPLEGDNASSGRTADKIFFGMATGSGLFVILLVILVGVFLVAKAIPAVADDHANFLTSRDWNVSDPMHFGIVQMLWTTVASSLVALFFAVPFAIALGLFLTQYSPPWLARPAAVLIDLLSAVPSIVYGLWGIALFQNSKMFAPVQHFLSDVLGWIPLFSNKTAIGDSQSNIFFVGIVLAIMILPIITALVREIFAQTPAAHKEAALALGATKWEMIRTTVLPFGKPGIISASMLGLGRALGETIAVMYILSSLADNTKWSWSLFNGGYTFASKIASDSSELSGAGTGAYIAAGLVLFVLTFIVNAIARVIIERRKAFTE
ncbi:phosphate ABC transporter permease subunit PstC [Calidifontibacter terrae]